MWNFCKSVRNLRCKLREILDVNRNSSGNNEVCHKPIEKCLPKCRLQSWYEGTGNDDSKDDASNRTWKKESGCPVGSDFGSWLEAVGLGTAVLVGVQFIWLKRETRLARQDDQLSNFHLKDYCVRNFFPLSKHWLGGLHPRLSILPEKATLPAQISPAIPIELPEQAQHEDFVPTLPSCSDYDWKVDFSLPDLCSSSENKTETTQDDEEVVRIVSLRDELVTAANQCVAVIQNKIGLQLAAENHSNQALSYFKAACELGDSRACFNAGVCYESGLGTQKDLTKAKEYYQQAANLGHATAMYNLGVYYLEGRGGEAADEIRGLELMESAAGLDVLEAQRFMAVHYLETEQKSKAVPWLEAAVEKKDTDSQFYLGLCYENGWGVDENLAKAADLYSRAAENGHAEAAYNLGVFHELGLGGLPQCEESAEELYSKAASRGSSEAAQRLEDIKRRRSFGFENGGRSSFSLMGLHSQFFGSGLIRPPSSRSQEFCINCNDNGHIFNEFAVNAWSVRRSSIS